MNHGQHRRNAVALALLVLLGAATVTGCGGPSAQEIAAHKHAVAKAKQRAANAKAVDLCDKNSRHVRTALEDVNARLNSGIGYADYQTKVGDVQVAFSTDNRAWGRSVQATHHAGHLDLDCFGVMTPLAGAVDSHTRALRTWEKCINDYNCTIDKGPKADAMQKEWRLASKLADNAENELDKLHRKYPAR